MKCHELITWNLARENEVSAGLVNLNLGSIKYRITKYTAFRRNFVEVIVCGNCIYRKCKHLMKVITLVQTT